MVEFEKLGLSDKDEEDKTNFQAIAKAMLPYPPENREKLLEYISGSQERSTKDIKETLDKLQVQLGLRLPLARHARAIAGPESWG